MGNHRYGLRTRHGAKIAGPGARRVALLNEAAAVFGEAATTASNEEVFAPTETDLAADVEAVRAMREAERIRKAQWRAKVADAARERQRRRKSIQGSVESVGLPDRTATRISRRLALYIASELRVCETPDVCRDIMERLLNNDII